jgi:chitinase
MLRRSKSLRWCFALIAVLWMVHPVWGQHKEIIGYYPSWKWNSRNNLVTPAMLPFDKLTMINYAFFYPLPDGQVVGRDTIGDEIILKGAGAGDLNTHDANRSLVALAHRHNVKVLLSVGGWEDSGNFSVVAASPDARQRFAHSCVEQIRKFGFDGIDVDWEYPCYVDHKGTAADRLNFTILLNTTRDSLVVLGKELGKQLLLTAAIPAGASLVAHFEIEKIANVLDMLNVMTYDFSGPWVPVSGHNAPLYSATKNDSMESINSAFKLFTRAYGVSPDKLNIGIPFYGHAFAGCTSMGASHTGEDTTHFSHGCSYYDIVGARIGFTRYWDDVAKVPYLVSIAGRTLVSYDDEESVGYKAQYVLDQKAGGVIIWEITGDHLSDGSTPLLDVIVSKLRGGK